MAISVVQSAMCQCSMGAAPTPLNILPINMVFATTPLASISDCVPFLNIMPFGVCTSMANPSTAALTAAAFGVLTPGPCIPTPAGTWIPGCPNVLLKSGPSVTNNCKLICAFGGVIQIVSPGQTSVMAG